MDLPREPFLNGGVSSRATPLLFAALVASCGGTEVVEEPLGPPESACGIAELNAASECTGLADCGAGAQNFSKDPTCDNCLHSADSHVCEAGACREMESLELVSVVLSVSAAATNAQSFTIAALNPIAADGARITCEKLLGPSCDRLNNAVLNAVNSTHKRFSGAGASPDMVYQTGISAEPGEGRILFVQATSEMSGDGTIMARGCVEDITVPLPADMNRLAIELVAP